MSLVLVVDDKEMLRDSVGQTLSRHGLEVQTADSASAALELIAARRPDCVVTDLKMPGMTGIELLERIRTIDEDLPVVLMTAFGTVETAVKAVKMGAFDYITKPFEGDELIISVKRAIEHIRVLRENALLKAGGNVSVAPAQRPAGASSLFGIERLIGSSPAMRRVKEQVLAVAESHGTVLICGESGSGKEVVARAIHETSPRSAAPFLGLNCAALSESLLESELFGHERGAFTGAEKLRKGRFELADGGTLLLDEISEIPTRIQAKLLRVLQERVFERVGSSMPIGCDVRVVATSNQDLPKAIARGAFRQDLFFRLNVLPIHLPPLRDRLEDVPDLARHFLACAAARDGRTAPELSDDAVAVLAAYSWPGTVRELHNICERAVALCRSGVIDAGVVGPWLSAGTVVNAMPEGAIAVPGAGLAPATLSTIVGHGEASVGTGPMVGMPEPKPFSGPAVTASGVLDGLVRVTDRPLEDIERDAIIYTLSRFNGHRQKTAQVLGIGVRTLGLKLKRWKELNLVDVAL
ncbi:MAG: sigma-54-dependent transcriptional regulator [Planctomyces sp.]